MGTPQLIPTRVRSAFALPALIVMSACATGGMAGSGAASPAPGAEADHDRGPRVQIWTREENFGGDRISASFRLDEDAYVVVVNVGRDGYASVVFPESPDDDGFLRGGRTYRLPAFFPGFPRQARSEYRRFHNATSSYDDVYDRYAGYVFVIASWRPMHFQLSEALGLWDDYRLAAHEQRLDPYVVMHRFADQLVPGRTRDYTAKYARYAAFDRGFGGRSAFAQCSAYGSPLGAYPAWAFYGLLAAGWVPIYGYSHFDLGAPGCGIGFGLSVVGFRPGGRIVLVPRQPTMPPDTTAKPTSRPPRPPRTAHSDSGERKPIPGRGGRRTEVAIDDHRIIDLTRETREQLRREERGLERARRALTRESYEHTDGVSRAERVRASERSGARTDDGRARANTANDDNARARRERPREESRPVERREAPPPRTEPRAEPRPQPETRSEPRSEPPRSEPRGGKPKP